jgi:hypothetical protein
MSVPADFVHDRFIRAACRLECNQHLQLLLATGSSGTAAAYAHDVIERESQWHSTSISSPGCGVTGLCQSSARVYVIIFKCDVHSGCRRGHCCEGVCLRVRTGCGVSQLTAACIVYSDPSQLLLLMARGVISGL